MPSESSSSPAYPWRSQFHRTSRAVYVIGSARRLRYANPAWEALTGLQWPGCRGMKISQRRSASATGQALAPPPEVWAGATLTVRRAVPPESDGPPWWDITFVPLKDHDTTSGCVLGFLTLVGSKPSRGSGWSIPVHAGNLRYRQAECFPFEIFRDTSLSSQRLVAQLQLAATTSAPVWILGAAGVGKETAARVIHHQSEHREKAFLRLDCEGVPAHLLEGQLFGRGGLLESKAVGTLYLKNPASLPRDTQQRLLDYFQEDRPRPRLICGSRTAASAEVAAHRLLPSFQADYSAFTIRIPSLVERVEDLPRMVERLRERFSDGVRFRDDLLPALKHHRWPGNIRELRDVLASAACRAGDDPVAPEHLPRFVQECRLLAENPLPKPGRAFTLDEVLTAVEKRMIELALRRSGNSQTAAAAKLGIPRTRLIRRIESLGVTLMPGNPPPPPEGEA